MTKPALILSFAALAVFGWSLPVAHSAPPAASATDRQLVAIEVDVGDLAEGERAIASVVLEHMHELVEAGGYEVSSDAEMVLRVRLRRLEAGDRNYGIHFEFVDGDAAEPAIEWTDCVFCTEARMLQKLDASKEELLGAIRERQDDEGATDGGSEETGGDGDTGDGDTAEPKPVKPIGALGGAGIGVAVVGIGVTIGGVVELARGRVYDDGAETNDQRTGTDHRPPGYVLIGVGAAATVAGVVMLAVDLSQRAKQRKHTQRAQAILVPSLTSIGVGVVGRF